jgi:hypothetical protein
LKLKANLFDHGGRGSDGGVRAARKRSSRETPCGVRGSSSAKGWACGKCRTGQTRWALEGLAVTARFAGWARAVGKRLTARFAPHKRLLC